MPCRNCEINFNRGWNCAACGQERPEDWGKEDEKQQPEPLTIEKIDGDLPPDVPPFNGKHDESAYDPDHPNWRED